MADNTDIMLFGTMGDIADIALRSLLAHGLKAVSVPFPQNVCRDAPGYERELFKAMRVFSPRMVMPIGNTLTFSSLAERFPDGICAAIGKREHIELLDSKISAYSLAESLGIPQPRRYSCCEEIEQYPVIFKRERSFGGSGVYKPHTRQALENLMLQEPGGRYLVEEFIEGTDYSIDCVTDGRKLRTSCYRCTANRGQGPSVARECVRLPELEEYAGRILAHIGFKGVCGMDFRVDALGNAFFLECNPRLCGGLATQIESGFDIPWMLYLMYSDSRR